jgi:hypothetical protein
MSITLNAVISAEYARSPPAQARNWSSSIPGHGNPIRLNASATHPGNSIDTPDP